MNLRVMLFTVLAILLVIGCKQEGKCTVVSEFKVMRGEYEYQGKKIQDRFIPVILTPSPHKEVYKLNEPILITLSLKNNFEKGKLYFERFTLKPNE